MSSAMGPAVARGDNPGRVIYRDSDYKATLIHYTFFLIIRLHPRWISVDFGPVMCFIFPIHHPVRLQRIGEPADLVVELLVK